MSGPSRSARMKAARHSKAAFDLYMACYHLRQARLHLKSSADDGVRYILPTIEEVERIYARVNVKKLLHMKGPPDA